jgi:D-alanyl-lipoteichoic acid acyltransferase DltB (MBOAT superfamily)
LAGVSHPSIVNVKSLIIVLVSLFVLWQFFGLFIVQLIFLVAGLTLLYAYMFRVEHIQEADKHPARIMAIVAIGALFTFKKSISLSLHVSGVAWLPTLGLAYLSLKLVSFVFDTSSRTSASHSWMSFLAYSLFAPTYLAGPIFDYQYFQKQLILKRTWLEHGHQFLIGIRRIILGLFKTKVLSFVTSHYTFYTWPEQTLIQMPWWGVIAIMQLTLVDLYFNFSGYTDIAIGVANCFGLSIPENFNLPFLARNLQEFWSRWHISLAEWFRMYIFSPMYRQLLRFRILRNRSGIAAGLAIILTFLLMGFWHGLQLNYLLYGFMHGIGFVVMLGFGLLWKVSDTENRPLRILLDGLFRFLTFQYISIALLVFYANNPQQWHLLGSVLRRVL